MKKLSVKELEVDLIVRLHSEVPHFIRSGLDNHIVKIIAIDDEYALVESVQFNSGSLGTRLEIKINDWSYDAPAEEYTKLIAVQDWPEVVE